MGYGKYTGHRKSYGPPKVEAGSRSHEPLPEPSKYGRAILDAIKNTSRNIAVKAVAGSGKTTLLRQIAQELTPAQRARATFIAFGKKIADELKLVLPPELNSSTAHSKGLAMLRTHGYPTNKVDKDKYRWLLNDIFNNKGYDFEKLGFSELNETLQACKLCMLNLVDPTGPAFDDMLAHYSINPYADMVQNISEALSIGSSENGLLKYGIDFTDQVYLPIRFNLQPTYKYDLVMVDECQDLSNALSEIAIRHMTPGGRMVIVGDPRQAIFGFAGANPESYDSLTKRLDALELPLSVCYRCPKSHIALANENLPDMGMESHSNAIEGVITNHSYDEGMALLKYHDLVVCRTNAPLLGMAFSLLKNDKAVTMAGREITTQVSHLAKRIIGSEPFGELLDKIPAYADAEREKLAKRRNAETQLATFDDQIECLTILLERALSHGVKSINAFQTFCRELFPDRTQAIKLGSVHSAKGLEAHRVFILQPELLPLRMPQEWQQKQESYLKNVALTRSKEHLGFIAKKPRN